MSRSNNLFAVLAVAVMAGTAAGAADLSNTPEQPYKFFTSVAGSVMWPRMNELNHSMSYNGNDFTNMAYRMNGMRSDSTAKGFHSMGAGFGSQLNLGFEFDDELRGGVQVGMNYVSTNDELTLTPLTTCTCWTTTNYFASQTVTLPLFELGVFFQRVFRFEETPQMRLYMGGWGNLGILLAASISGKTYNEDIYPVVEYRYKASLSGSSWGAGALGGIEYDITPYLAGYVESGFEYLVIKTVERTGTVDQYLMHDDANGVEVADFIRSDYSNSPRLRDGYERNIPLDFSGVFIRGGLKLGLNF